MNELPALLLRFVGADTWTDSLQILRDHEDVLLSDLADVAMGMFIDGAEAAGDDAAGMLRAHRTLLSRCRQIGIDAAFAELQGGQAAGPADGGHPPAELFEAVLLSSQAGDRRGEATARFGLGAYLVERDAHRASDEMERAGRLFAELDAPFEASMALLNAAIARNNADGARASLELFEAAQAQVDRAASRPPPPGHDLGDVRIRVQAAWLDALIELEGDDPSGGIAEAALRRCDEVLALTADCRDGVAVFARHTAHYHRVRLLVRRNRFVDALPSARAVLDHRQSDDDAEWRPIARQMHTAIAAAQLELGQRADAGEHFVSAARLAVPDHDVLTVDLVLLGLNRAFRRDPGTLADLVEDLPAAFAAAGDRASTARLVFAHAQARDMTPGAPDLDRTLSIIAEYRAAADMFAGLGEVGREANGRYGAGHALSNAALLHEEHRDGALAELEHAERLFRTVANWHGAGIALMGQGELLNRWYPDVVREDARVARLSAATVEAFERAGRPAEEASARLMQAVDTAMHSADPDLFVERCSAAFEANERGRASRILPTDRTFHDGSVGRMITLLAKRTTELLADRADDPRTADLVWGLDQIAKSRTMSDDLAAPAQWQEFLTRDPVLADATRRVEKTQLALEEALRNGRPAIAGDARNALDAARREQHRRLEELADESPTALDLTSVAPVDLRAVRELLGPGEVFVSLTSCRDDLYFRIRLTSTGCEVDVVEAPGSLRSLIKRRESTSSADEQRLRVQMRSLLGSLSGTTTLIVCPDPALAAVPWHLLDAGDGHLLGDRMATGVIPAAGVLAQLRHVRSRPAPDTDYLGIADESGTSAAAETGFIRDRYFPRTGRTVTTRDGRDLTGIHGRVGLLHIGTHAYAGGLTFGDRSVTPIDLAGMDLAADLLLLTGCYMGAFAHDDNNEFFGIVRQLLVATGARAAVVSAERIPDKAPVRFADLLVAALTGSSAGRPWGAIAPMPVGEAVRWARLMMRELGRAALDDPAERAYWLPARRLPSWSPWFVVGDPGARLGGSTGGH